jgi:hypothetical protein
VIHETHVAAEQKEAGENPRIPETDGHQKRSEGAELSPKKGP